METHDIQEQQIRETAYFLWERDGKPEGSANRYWDVAEALLKDARSTANERSPKGDRNRRLALGIDPEVFAREAGITAEQLQDYECNGSDEKFDLMVAHQVGLALKRHSNQEAVTKAIAGVVKS